MTPNNPVIALAAAGLGTTNKAVRLDAGAKGVLVLINIPSAATGTLPTLTVTIQGVTPDANVTSYDILASTALAATATGVTQLLVYPGSPVSANATSDLAVPMDINIKAVVGGTTPAVTANISVIPLQ